MKSLAVVAVALTVAGLGSGVAQAESAPGCSSTVQIGSTAYITYQGETAASVKQFKGCGDNWAYIYLWDQFRAKHLNYFVMTYIVRDGRAFGAQQSLTNPRELWSDGTNTLTVCTQAEGLLSIGDWTYAGTTDMRC